MRINQRIEPQWVRREKKEEEEEIKDDYCSSNVFEVEE